MICDTVQRRLLAGESPDQVEGDLRAHLAACPACRDWRGRLLRLERNVPYLPVPVSRGKARLLRELLYEDRLESLVDENLESPSPALAECPVAPMPLPSGARSGVLLTPTRIAAGVAAALLLLALGWWWLHRRTADLPPPTGVSAGAPAIQQQPFEALADLGR
jgi:hypothetical protein